MHRYGAHIVGDKLMQNFENLAEHALEAVALLKVLANENRLMICCSLDAAELSVTELNERVPLSQSALSQHLAKLREAGVLTTRRASQTIYYRIADKSAIKVIETLKSIYCPEL